MVGYKGYGAKVCAKLVILAFFMSLIHNKHMGETC